MEGNHAKMKQNTPTWVSDLSLNLDDKNAILLGDLDWLTDKHISAANQLLKRGFPQCKGLDLFRPTVGFGSLFQTSCHVRDSVIDNDAI